MKLTSLLLIAPLAAASCGTSQDPPPPPHGLAFPMYHFDTSRTGWSDAESTLTPAVVRNGLARVWETPPLDDVTLTYTDGAGTSQTTTFPARTYASPLYLDDVTTSAGPTSGVATSVVFAATTSDFLYAIAAVDTKTSDGVVSAGTILWRASLGMPAYVAALDKGTPLGVLGTPFIDTSTTPPTLYVSAVDAAAGWRVFAVDAASGAVLPGWPVTLDPATVSALDGNRPPVGAPPPMADAETVSQRGALLLSAGTLYAGFGAYSDGAIGWMVAVDVATRQVVASFSGSPTVPTPPPDDPGNFASAGMWGGGGPALAGDGRIFVTTGNSPYAALSTPGVWGNSLLAWQPVLQLSATYTPFNYCVMDAGDTDLAGSSPVVFDLDPGMTTTPHLATFGGKQGVLYLVDRDRLGGSVTARPSCNRDPKQNDPASDASLFGPTPLPAYSPASPGPLPVFGPYSDAPGANDLNHAKMRTTPALFRPSSGEVYVFVAGTSRSPTNLDQIVPPCVARLKVDLAQGQRAYFDADIVTNQTSVFKNPGSPIVTSHDGGLDPIVWVLDQNALRTDPIEPKSGVVPASAILYAFDGTTLETLWTSAGQDLGPSGKYGHVVVAHGRVLVATDRIRAYAPKE